MAIDHCPEHGNYSSEHGECPQCAEAEGCTPKGSESGADQTTNRGDKPKSNKRRSAKDRNAGTRRKKPSES